MCWWGQQSRILSYLHFPLSGRVSTLHTFVMGIGLPGRSSWVEVEELRAFISLHRTIYSYQSITQYSVKEITNWTTQTLEKCTVSTLKTHLRRYSPGQLQKKKLKENLLTVSFDTFYRGEKRKLNNFANTIKLVTNRISVNICIDRILELKKEYYVIAGGSFLSCPSMTLQCWYLSA